MGIQAREFLTGFLGGALESRQKAEEKKRKDKLLKTQETLIKLQLEDALTNRQSRDAIAQQIESVAKSGGKVDLIDILSNPIAIAANVRAGGDLTKLAGLQQKAAGQKNFQELAGRLLPGGQVGPSIGGQPQSGGGQSFGGQQGVPQMGGRPAIPQQGFSVPSMTIKNDGSMSIRLDQQGPVFKDMGDSIALLHPQTGQLLQTLPKDTPVELVDAVGPDGTPGKQLIVRPNAAGQVSFGGQTGDVGGTNFIPTGPSLAQSRGQEFMPESELSNVVMIDRENESIEPAPFNIRRSDLNDTDFVRVTPTQKKQLQGVKTALQVVQELRRTADKVFTSEAGLIERGAVAGRDVWEQLLQSNPNLVLFSSQSQGTASLLSRAMGEVGTMTDDDIKRAMKLVPRLRNRLGLPDTKTVKDRKLDALERLLRSQYNEVLGKQFLKIQKPNQPLLNELTKNALDELPGVAGQAERGFANRLLDLGNKGVEGIKQRFGLEDIP